MKRLIPWLAAAAFWLIPHPALAVTCSAGTPFATGQLITANSLNSPLQGLANCTNQLDYRNIGSAGILASQIIPQSASQATFGGSVPYTFTQPPTFSAPLTQANGGTGSTDGSINGVGFANGGLPTRPGLSTNGGPINLDSKGATGVGIGYDNPQISNIQFGPSGNWGNWTSSSLYLQGNLTLPGSYNLSAHNGTFSQGATVGSSGLNMTNANASGTSSIYVNSNGDIQFYDVGGGHNYNITIPHANGYVSAPRFDQNFAGTNKFPIPYDGNALNSTSNTAHIEHGSVIALSSSSSTSCAPTYTFQTPFTITIDYPNVTASVAGALPYGAYVQSVTASNMQVCVINYSGGAISANVSIQWIAVGE